MPQVNNKNVLTETIATKEGKNAKEVRYNNIVIVIFKIINNKKPTDIYNKNILFWFIGKWRGILNLFLLTYGKNWASAITKAKRSGKNFKSS